MTPVYRAILRLYPYDFRAAFETEMMETFKRPAVSELAGLLGGAAAEWHAKLTTDRTTRGRALPDLRMMRPVGVPAEVWFAGKICSSGMLR